MNANEMKAFADSLVERYKALKAKYPHLDTICIDLIGQYPADSEVDAIVNSMSDKWTLSPQRFNASPDDSGCIWMSPKSS